MSKKYDKGEITLQTPWDGDATTDNLPVSGRLVENLIKREFKTLRDDKTGYTRVTTEKNADGFYEIQTFVSKDAAAEYDASESDDEKEALLLSSSPIPILEREEGTTYPLGLTARSRAAIVSIDGKVEVEIQFTSSRKEPGAQAVENTVSGTLVIQARADNTRQWQQIKTVPIVSDNTNYQKIDISDCVEADIKDYQVRMYVTVNDETVKGTKQSVTWQSITKTTLSLSYASDWSKALSGNVYNPEYNIRGVVNKTLNVKITNTEGTSRTETVVVGDGEYTTQTFRGFSFADTSNFKMLSIHGVYSIESWLSVTGEPEKQSPHIYNQVMVKADATEITPHILIQDISPDVPFPAQNYVQAQLFRYAVYNPSGEALPLEFRLTDYGETNIYASYPADNPQSEMQYTFNSVVEIEDAVGSTILAMFRAVSDGDNMSAAYPVQVDNSQNYAPAPGADFILNPKLRSNSETNPARIVNARTGQEVTATMTGFTFADGIDGWTTDEQGRRCLRVPAGRHISILYDIWAAHRRSGSKVSASVEMLYAVRNVIDEDTPIFRSSNDALTRGIVMKPLEGVVYTAGNTSYDEQKFAWREDKTTHAVVNILHNYNPMPENPRVTTPLSVCRVAINGVINREFSFDSNNATEWFAAGQGQTIEIGQDNADIDIYALRIYANSASTQLTAADILQNYISCLPTAAEKNRERERNDIMQGGKITLEKVLAKGLDVWCWRGRLNSKEGAASGGTTDKKNNHGDLKIWRHKDDGTLDRKHSGVINDTDHSPQGSTANSYSEHNQQDKMSEKSKFTDLDGGVHEGYAIDDTVAEAKKLVNKINWASAMQSHKAGSTALYNDLYKLMCADDKKMMQENPKARVAVLQKPVYMFVEDPETGETTFVGIGTFGPGKMDKPTWGYDKKKYPEFCMVEGADNNRTLTDMRCPWDESVTYDPDEECFFKGGLGSMDFNAGQTDENEVPTGQGIQLIKTAWNFVYECNPFIKHYDGTLAQLKADATANKTYQYWVTQSDQKFNVYRYNEIDESTGEWVDAGVNGEVLSIAQYATGLTDYEAITKAIINARVGKFKAAIDSRKHFYKNTMLMNRCYSKFIAGTDNQSKNTYYVVRMDIYGNLLIDFDRDDDDSIMLTNNISIQSKPYYIEERDKTPDGTGYYWEGQFNALYMLVDLAYKEELRTTMHSMLTHMGNLVTKPGLTKDAAGCMEQYFFSIQEYFCPVAYNETARIRYEANESLYVGGNSNLAGSRGTAPLVQSIGDQLEAERQYMERRLAYLSSWCNYGIFGGAQTTSGAWIFPVSSNANGADQPVTIKFKLTPHQWLYASGKSGGTVIRSDVRMEPGKQYEFSLLQGASIASDTEHALNGIDYYRSVGNLGDMPIGTPNNTLNVAGKRLIEFIAEPTNTTTPQFRPQAVAFNGSFKMIRRISLNGCAQTGGTMNLSNLGRLESVDVRNTLVTGVQLPQTSTLTEVHLSEYTTAVDINDQPNLETLTVQSYANLTTFSLQGRHKMDSYNTVSSLYDANPVNLASLKVDNVAWTDCSRTILMWLTDRECELSGAITMDAEDGRISFADKIKLGKAFGNIDTGSKGLKINYLVTPMQQTDLAVNCRGFMTEVGKTYPVTAATNTATVNSFALTDEGEIDATISLTTGAANFAEVAGMGVKVKSRQQRDSETRYDLTLSLKLMGGTTLTIERPLAFCIRTPKLGDFAYADGTFDSYYSPASALVGIVYKVERDTTVAKETYTVRVVSLAAGNTEQNFVWGMHPNTWNATKTEIDAAVAANVWDVAAIPNYGGSTPTDPRTLFDEGVTATGAAADFNGKNHTEAIVTVCHELVENYCRKADPTIQFPTCVTKKTTTDVTITETLTKLQTAFGPSAGQMLYLAALYCHLYEPTAEELDDQYRANNWYLPAMGEVVLMMYYASQGLTSSEFTGDNGDATAIFARAAYRAALSQVITFAPVNSWFWSSSEISNTYNVWSATRTSSTPANYKSNRNYVRPVAAFKFEI